MPTATDADAIVTGISTRAMLLDRSGKPYGKGCDAYVCEMSPDGCRALLEGAAPVQTRPGARVRIEMPVTDSGAVVPLGARVEGGEELADWGMAVRLRFVEINENERNTIHGVMENPRYRAGPAGDERRRRKMRRRSRRRRTHVAAAVAIAIAIGVGGALLLARLPGWLAELRDDPASRSGKTAAGKPVRELVIEEVKKEIESGDLSPEEAKRLYEKYGHLIDE